MTPSGTVTPVRRPWYSEEAGFFGNHYLNEYRDWMTPEVTLEQVTFLANLIPGPPGLRLLDLGCGAGRHVRGLAGRGFSVTGLDLNGQMLDLARTETERSKLKAEWVRADMRCLPFRGHFNAVVSMFTSFGFFDDDRDNSQVVEQVAQSLSSRGQFVLDILNREFVLERLTQNEQCREPGGQGWKHRRWLDSRTSRFHHERTRFGDAGEVERLETVVRMYSPEELCEILETRGMRVTTIYGGYRRQPLDAAQPRMILVAERSR